jgi:hypothetical protein
MCSSLGRLHRSRLAREKYTQIAYLERAKHQKKLAIEQTQTKWQNDAYQHQLLTPRSVLCKAATRVLANPGIERRIRTMNVVKSRSNNLPRATASLDGQYGKAIPNIDLYQEIPTIEVSLDDFEEFALDRLKVRITIRFNAACLAKFTANALTPQKTLTINRSSIAGPKKD